jgi:uncharacterized membrane protein YsdA (DUF1294 family)
MNYILIWAIIISTISVIVTVYDKIAAKATAQRIPEKALMIIGLLGGATAMLITMLIIRHKTRHIKFMLGLPIEILLHTGIITAVATLM